MEKRLMDPQQTMFRWPAAWKRNLKQSMRKWERKREDREKRSSRVFLRILTPRLPSLSSRSPTPHYPARSNTQIHKYTNTKCTNTQTHIYANTLMHKNTNKKNSHHNSSASAGNKRRTLIEYNIQIQLGQLKAYKYTYGSQLNRQHPTC